MSLELIRILGKTGEKILPENIRVLEELLIDVSFIQNTHSGQHWVKFIPQIEGGENMPILIRVKDLEMILAIK